MVLVHVPFCLDTRRDARDNYVGIVIVTLKSSRHQPIIFLDRDGTIIQNIPGYVRSKSQVEFIPGAIEAIKLFNSIGAWVFIITNQSAIGRGLILKVTAEHINMYVQAIIESKGGMIHGIYMCPHHPAEKCTCRKPGAKLLNQAIKEHGLDSINIPKIIIGDARSDLEASSFPNMKAVLVKTGLGKKTFKANQFSHWLRFKGFSVYNDLKQAAEELVKDFEQI